MANYRSSNSARTSTFTPRTVSPARLNQPTGARHAFGGYTKVDHRNGTFSMRKTGK